MRIRSRRSRPKRARPCRQTSQINRLKWEPSVIEKITEGSLGGESITKGGFLVDTPLRFPRPHNHCEHASEARARLGQGNTEAREPRAGFAPGVPELSLILGSRPYSAGCRGMGRRIASERQQHLCRGMGVPYGSPNSTRLEPAHCHIPLCVRATDLYFGIFPPSAGFKSLKSACLS